MRERRTVFYLFSTSLKVVVLNGRGRLILVTPTPSSLDSKGSPQVGPV